MAALRHGMKAVHDLNLCISKDANRLWRCVYEAGVFAPLCAGHTSKNMSQVVHQVRTLSPAVRYLVGTHKIEDTSVIEVSGPKSRLLKGDVLKYLADLKTDAPLPKKPARQHEPVQMPKSPATATHAQYTDISVTSEQREAAAGLVRAKKETPHVYLSVDCEVPSWLSEQGESVIKAHVLKCIAQTLQEEPEVSMAWDRSSTQSVSRPSVAITTSGGGVKSALPSVLPVDTIGRMSLGELAATIATGGTSTGSSSISVTYCHNSSMTGQTSILLPGQTLALCVMAQQHHRCTTSTITVAITGDGRVLELEVLAKWVSALKDNFLRTV